MSTDRADAPIEATYTFPRRFLWGTATAAHQVEGNNTNNTWWEWEQSGHASGTSGLACDWWGGRWREDFDRAAESGQKAHRLSVEWSRIQPTPDQWDEDALERYRAMLRGLIQRGLTPMVTLHHFSDPIWIAEQKGWETPEIVRLFERFVRKTVEALREYCSLWCTINEPNVYATLGYLAELWPPGQGQLNLCYAVLANMVRAHAAAYAAIHELQPQAMVGYTLHYRPMRSRRSWFPPDLLMRYLRDRGLNLGFPSAISTGRMRAPLWSISVPEAKGTQDFFGLNYYTRETVWFDLLHPKELFSHGGYPKDADLSEHGATANIPEGLYDSIQWVARLYPGTPIYVTENGIESTADVIRRRYLAQHVHQMWRALNHNYPLKGYFHWTLVDSFEWERGWDHRFGLWALDVETQRRTKRPSADLYAAICAQNALTSEMVRQYCPEVFDKIFPPFEG